MARKIVEEKYDLKRRIFVQNKDANMKDSTEGRGIARQMSCFGMSFCSQSKTTSEANQILREKYIKLFLHDIWRYALSFVLIHRGDTEIESDESPYNWPLERYGGDGITDEVKYLTYWPIKMLRQIGIFSNKEFTGSAISDYMKNVSGENAKENTNHICLKREKLLQNEQPTELPNSNANGSAVNEDFQQRSKGNAASTLFKFSELARMQAGSIDECEQGR
jgi:hypothetical protein